MENNTHIVEELKELEKDHIVSELMSENASLRETILELRRILRHEREAWSIDREHYKNILYKRKNRKWQDSEFDKEYNEVRVTILERDDYKCTECGCDKHLHVHHIIHRKDGGTNDENNLVTLCKWCHAEKHKDQSVYKLMEKSL